MTKLSSKGTSDKQKVGKKTKGKPLKIDKFTKMPP
jgi:predicted transcriptional regulator